MELPEWDGPTDEAELDAIEWKAAAESAALLLHSSNKSRRPSRDRVVLGEWGRSVEQEVAAGANVVEAEDALLFSSREGRLDRNPIVLEDDADVGSHRRTARRLPDWGANSNTSGGSRGSRKWSLLRPSCNEHKTKVKYPVIKFGGRIVYSRTAPEAEKATAEILELIKSNPHSGDELISMGFDIEWKPTFRSGETPRKAAVIQICVSNSHCYVMHIIHCGIPPLLRSLLEDYSFIKVGVGIANDAAKMFKDYNVHIGALEELSGLANLKLGGTAKNWGLGSLTEMLTCKELAKPKKIRLGNWEVNVLSKEQVVYAATDAYVSWYLHQILKSLPDNSCRDEKPDQANGIA